MRAVAVTWQVLLGLLFLVSAAEADRPQRLVIVSAPKRRRIYVAELPSFHDLTVPIADRPVTKARMLIDGTEKCLGPDCSKDADRGLQRPVSLALHQTGRSATLYVADVEAGNIYAYSLHMNWQGQLEAGHQRVAREGIAGGPTGLAVDSMGNIIYTTAEDGGIHLLEAGSVGNTSATVQDLLTAEGAPSGLAADGLFLYWSNSKGDDSTGPISRGPQRPAALETSPVQAIVEGATAYESAAESVCVARDNVFFTTAKVRSLLGTKVGGGKISEVARNFKKPRGCVYDGEGTLYLADGEADGIYSMPANLGSLRAVRHPVKVVSIAGPDQMVIFSGPSSLLQMPDVHNLAGPQGPSFATLVGLALLTVVVTATS